MRKRLSIQTLIYILAAMALAACSSMHVQVPVQRLPALDTSGIRSIAVMPFSAYQNTALQNEVARSLTATVTSRIAATGHFILVDSNAVQRLINNRQSILDHVDALFEGQIVILSVNDSSYQTTRYDRNTRSNVPATMYVREVELVFTYSIVRTRDGTITGPITRRGTSRDNDYNQRNLRSASSLAQVIVNNQLSNLAQDLTPHTVNERRTLMTDRSDRNLRSSMDSAFSMVRARDYRGARNAYLQIYETHGNYPALYNAAILSEVMGDPEAAVELFGRHLNRSGDNRARTEMDRVGRSMNEQRLIASTIAQSSESPRDRALSTAVDEIQKYLPPGARVWVYNGVGTDPFMANGVVLDISSALLRDGVLVVDRDTAALRAAEMEFQLTGYVRDEDILRLGNAAGANFIVEISIQGLGPSRRLQMKIVDIEKGIPVMTSDTSERWHL